MINDDPEEEIEEQEIDIKVADLLFRELPRTPRNISKYLKIVYSGQKGKGFESMFAGAQIAAAEIRNIKKYIHKLTIMPITAVHLFEKQQDARAVLARALGEPDDRWSEHVSDSMAGDLSRPKTFREFKRMLTEVYGHGRHIDLIPDTTLRHAWKELRGAYQDIPSEYFEAKSYEPVDVNQFRMAYIPNGSRLQRKDSKVFRGTHEGLICFLEGIRGYF